MGRACACSTSRTPARQIGYYRVTGTDETANPTSNSWDLAWNGSYVYLSSLERGALVCPGFTSPEDARL